MHELPDFFTVEEAAAMCRIGRTAAYLLARRWLATDGQDGLPVVRIGHQLRVPRAQLELMAGGALNGVAVAAKGSAAQPLDRVPSAGTSFGTKSASAASSQSPLPFGG